MVKRFYQQIGCNQELEMYEEQRSSSSSDESVTDSDESFNSERLNNISHIELINSVEDNLHSYWQLCIGFILKYDNLF